MAPVDSPTNKDAFQLEESGAFITKDSGKPKKRRTLASKMPKIPLLKTAIPKDVLRKRLKKKLKWIGIALLIVVLVIVIIVLATRETKVCEMEPEEKG